MTTILFGNLSKLLFTIPEIYVNCLKKSAALKLAYSSSSNLPKSDKECNFCRQAQEMCKKAIDSCQKACKLIEASCKSCIEAEDLNSFPKSTFDEEVKKKVPLAQPKGKIDNTRKYSTKYQDEDVTCSDPECKTCKKKRRSAHSKALQEEKDRLAEEEEEKSSCDVKMVCDPCKENKCEVCDDEAPKPRPYCSAKAMCDPCREKPAKKPDPFVIENVDEDVLCDMQDGLREKDECDTSFKDYFGDCYKNEEYFTYHRASFYDFLVYLTGHHGTQPNSKCPPPKKSSKCYGCDVEGSSKKTKC